MVKKERQEEKTEERQEEKEEEKKKEVTEKEKSEEKGEENEEKIEEGGKEKGEESEELLVPLQEYMRSGMHLGTSVITAYMRKYVYRRRPDGLATINTKKIDSMLRVVANFLSFYKPEEIVVVCKRQSGWEGAIQFGKVTGIRVFTKKYPAGIITNTNLPEFFEPSLMLIADPWLDVAPLHDAVKLNIPVVALCDTNNITTYVDLVAPCNNKSSKSIGLIFWILAREYIKKRGIKVQLPAIEEFAGEEEVASEAEPPVKSA